MKHQLEVDRTELERLFEAVGRFGRTAEKAKAALSFDGTDLVVSLPGMKQGARATGFWPGQVIIPVSTLVRLSQAPLPGKDPVLLGADCQALQIGTLRVPAAWEDEVRPLIELPLDAPLWALLSLPNKHGSEEIERSGLTGKVAEALKERDALLVQAHEILERLGITRLKLTEFVDAHIRSLP